MHERLERVRSFMAEQGLGAFLVTRQANFHWLTGGGRGFLSLATEGAVGQILVLPHRAVLLVNEIEAGRLAAEEVDAGLEVRTFPWYDEGQAGLILRELTGEAPVGADFPMAGALHQPLFDRLRWHLTDREHQQARLLGADAASALELVCREFRQGESEQAVAGRLAAALWERAIEPTALLVAGDERAYRYRHPLPTAHPIRRYGLLAICGRRHGLVLSASRMVHFGPPPADLVYRHRVAATVDARVIQETRPGRTAGELFDLLRQAYADGGFPDEWRRHHQGGLAGYLGREWRALPGGSQRVEAGQIFAWNPTVEGAKSEDTILVGEGSNQVLTLSGTWPEGPLGRPGILTRR